MSDVSVAPLSVMRSIHVENKSLRCIGLSKELNGVGRDGLGDYREVSEGE